MNNGPSEQILFYEKIDSFGKKWRNFNFESKYSDRLGVQFTKMI